MQKKTIIIIVSVIGVAALASGLGVLIWWLVRDTSDFTTIELEGDGLGITAYRAAITRIRGAGNMFWWFYPTTAAAGVAQPLLLWLDGITGVPPSLLANLAMIGPYDVNLNRREDSWVEEFNLLFVDAPIGTGFSTVQNNNGIPTNLAENADHLVFTLTSFFELHEEYSDSPLYIVGQGSGAQLALELAIRLSDTEVPFNHTLTGVVLSNGIVSPALALTKLGFYMEEMGYIDYVGREAIETLSTDTTSLVNDGNYAEAFDKFISLGDFVNNEAQTVAVNLGHIVEKLTREATGDSYFFGQKQYLRSLFPYDLYSFMSETVGPALGVSSGTYDSGRTAAVQAVRNTFMIPAVNKVEHILENTRLKVTIYNGNLDAVSNTPGQLEWVNNLQWHGQQNFTSSPRQTLVVDGLVQGYFRENERLQFYWINAAGQWTPLDSPRAMRRVIQRTTEKPEEPEGSEEDTEGDTEEDTEEDTESSEEATNKLFIK